MGFIKTISMFAGFVFLTGNAWGMCNFGELITSTHILSHDEWVDAISAFESDRASNEGPFFKMVLRQARNIAINFFGERDAYVIDEVSQRVAVRFAQPEAFASIKEADSIKNWVATMVRNQLRDETDRARRQGDPRSMERIDRGGPKYQGDKSDAWIALPGTRLTPPDLVIMKEERRMVADRLAMEFKGTSEHQRQILRMFRDGRTHEEIASGLQIPVGTVKTRVRIMTDALKQSLSTLPYANPGMIESKLLMSDVMEAGGEIDESVTRVVNSRGADVTPRSSGARTGGADLGRDPVTLEEAISMLKPIHQEVAILYMFENRNHRQIAEKLGIAMITVRQRWKNGKKALAQILANAGIQDPRFAAKLGQ